MHDPDAEENTARTNVLLSDSCDELLGSCCDAVSWIQGWLGEVRTGRFRFWVREVEKDRIWQERMDGIQKLRDGLVSVLEQFRNEKRYGPFGDHRLL